MQIQRPTPGQLVAPTATIAAATGAFAILADAAADGDGIATIDPHVAADVLTFRTSSLTSLAQLLSFVGSEIVLSVLALILVIALLERRGARFAGLAVVAMAVSAGLTVGIKLAIGRDRPGTVDRLGPLDTTHSFPSGHTLNSAVFLGLLCLLLVPLLQRRGARFTSYGLAAVLALGIGASRIYLGYHWTTDVFGSWTIAAILLTLVHVVERGLRPAAEQSGSDQVDHATVDS